MTNTNHIIAINITQRGLRGEVTMDVAVSGPDGGGPLPEVYNLGAYLTEVTKVLIEDLDDRVEDDGGTLYRATFELTQPAGEEVFYSRVLFDPKVRQEDGKFADAYVIINTVVKAYLQAIGMMDDDGNLIPDSENDLDHMDVQVSDTRTLH